MAVPCGKAVQGRICIRGSGGRDWPEVEAPFYYISMDGQTRYGVQHMKYGLPTTETKHEVGRFYPIKGTVEAAKITEIEGDRASVIVKYHGRDTCVFPRKTSIPLSSLLLVDEYTSLNGVPKTESTSMIPKIANTPPKKGSPARKQTIRGRQTTAIAVGTNVVDVYARLIELSSDHEHPVILAMTHAEMPEDSLVLREFPDMNSIARLFYTQGIMDEDDQGLSCGVEAVNNAGFRVTASSFSQQAAHGVDTDAFMVAKGGRGRNHDHFLDQSGGGNNIPTHQMYLTLETLVAEQGLEMDPRPWHHIRDLIGTPEFWVGHQWAIVQIPVCGGHWVSMEKIMYMGQPAVCLREGRGTVTYDFITSPDGAKERLPAGMTGTSDDKKRKR